MVINQSENEESGLILQSFSIVLLKIIPVVFSSRGKRGEVSYYSLQYSDETNLSLGSRKWGNCLRQRLPEGPECPWPHSVLSHGTGEDPGTVCIPPSHLAPGICRANCCFLLWQAAAITSRAAGLVWTRIIQAISPDSTKVSTVLSSAVPLGFLLNFFVLPQGANTECCCISQLSHLPAFGEGAVVSLSAEQTLRKITPLRTEHPGTVTCGTVTSVCVWTDRAKEERKMYGRVFLLIAPAPPCCKTSAWRELQQQVTAPEYEWGQYNLYVALCKWIIAFWLWFTVTGVFCS